MSKQVTAQEFFDSIVKNIKDMRAVVVTDKDGVEICSSVSKELEDLVGFLIPENKYSLFFFH